jgi:hypothetical protein
MKIYKIIRTEIAPSVRRDLGAWINKPVARLTSFHRETSFHECFLNGTGKCDLPVPYIFNGVSPSKMTALPEPEWFSFSLIRDDGSRALPKGASVRLKRIQIS